MGYISDMKEIYVLEDYATTEVVPLNFKLTEGYDAQLHGHSFVEIFYVISGSAPHRLDEMPVQTIQAGDTFLIMPSHTHEFLKRKRYHKLLFLIADLCKISICNSNAQFDIILASAL